MAAGVRRIWLWFFVALAMLGLAEQHLSDGSISGRSTRDVRPALWEEAVHADWPSLRPAAAPPASPAATANCPLILSLNRNDPYTLTTAEDGVLFDIDANGELEQVAWTAAGSDVGFLGIDRDGDGRITNGKDLLGNRTLPGVRNGPSALIALAREAIGGEQRAVLDHGNPLFFKLLLWNDRNHNGVSEAAELRPVAELVSGIGLGYERHHRRDRFGNESRNRGFVRVGAAPDHLRPVEEDMPHLRWFYDACLVTIP